MYLILDKTQVSVGGNVNATVYISTEGQQINNGEGTIHFPTDLLSVNSISNAGSIFNIWVEQPVFSNTDGTIYFNGGLPTPGFAGQSGTVIKINFKAKSAGIASLAFNSSVIRANDGLGTNVLTQALGANVSVTNVVTPVVLPVLIPEVTTPVLGVPKAPVFTSEDMPDQNTWYNKTDGLFYWDLSSEITSVQLVLSRSQNTAPSVIYDPPIKTKNLTNLADGVMYLNGRFKNFAGWGKIASRKIQIDTVAPENISTKSSTTEDDLVSIEASAKDSLSGVKSFAIFSENKKIIEVSADKNGKAGFNLPPISEGLQDLVIRTYDNAGNNNEITITVDAPEIKAPKITRYPEYIKIGDKIEIRGKSPYVNTDISVWIQQKGETAQNYLVKSDEDKVFSYTTDSMETAGVVSVWAETLRSGGVKSTTSDKVYISVKESDTIGLGKRAIEIISIAITVLVLLLILLLLIYLGIKKARKLRRNLKKDLLHTEQEIHKVFELLKGDTKRHIKMLEKASTKRKLTKEESKIFSELSEDLDETEKYLEEKIKNIEEQDLQ